MRYEKVVATFSCVMSFGNKDIVIDFYITFSPQFPKSFMCKHIAFASHLAELFTCLFQ